MHLTLLYSFFFNHTATTEIYTLSLHDALPISVHGLIPLPVRRAPYHPIIPPESHAAQRRGLPHPPGWTTGRSEEHTSELQSHHDLVCRLLLEKKKKKINNRISYKQQ